MARGVKYNVDVAAQEMNKKLFSQNQNMAPQDIIQNMMNVKSGRCAFRRSWLRRLKNSEKAELVN